METPVDIKGHTHEAADGHCRDKQHGILALREIGHHRIQADGKACQPQRVIEHLLVFLLDATVQRHADERAGHNRASIDNGS